MAHKKLTSFKQFIWQYYQQHGRAFAWRNIDNPYHIVVSEIMLQQTQTYRVEPKFDAFIEAFPAFEDLAHAPLRDVLMLWQGLGYNRRGKFLHAIAQKVMNDFDGVLPDNPEVLKMFPGIGPNTAGSICAFAFNKPVVFIETNIRTVFLHHFFSSQKEGIDDNEILPLIEQALDHTNPREWYYALMDYGVMLKKNHPNPSRKSKHHTKQSKFEGSDRQIRGMIVKLLTRNERLTRAQLDAQINREPERIEKALAQLVDESMVVKRGGVFLI